jgi:LacI family transcriptional regulator
MGGEHVARDMRARRGRELPAETVTSAARATIRDVAQRADVSVGTVSRALNGRAGVHPDTRRRVQAAVAELGYAPDRAARELSIRRPITVGLSVAHGHRRLIPFFVLFLEHLLEGLASSGLRVRDVPTGSDGLPTEATDALVLLGAHPDDPRIAHLQAIGRPFVLLGHRAGVRSVAADDAAGGRLAAEHLLRLGHRSMLHVTGAPHGQGFADRQRGFRDALAAAGAPAVGTLACDDATPLGGYRGLRRYLAEHPAPTAVFAATDELAVGCIAAASDLGLRVPHDLSVVGFDDLPEFGDGLTTIRQDIRALAHVTVELLHEGLRGLPVRSVRLPVTLLARGTTAERG